MIQLDIRYDGISLNGRSIYSRDLRQLRVVCCERYRSTGIKSTNEVESGRIRFTMVTASWSLVRVCVIFVGNCIGRNVVPRGLNTYARSNALEYVNLTSLVPSLRFVRRCGMRISEIGLRWARILPSRSEDERASQEIAFPLPNPRAVSHKSRTALQMLPIRRKWWDRERLV